MASTWNQLPKLVEKNGSLDQAPVPILWLDENGIVGYANERSSTTFGFATESLIGQTIDCLCSSMQLSNWQDEWWPILKHNSQIESLPMTFRHKKGSAIQRTVSISLVKVAEIFFAALYLWPKPVDNAVSSKDNSTAFLDILGESVCIMDRSGTIHYANPTLRQKFAVLETDLIGRPFLDFVSPAKSQLQKIWASLQQAERSEVEFECNNMAGESLVLRMNIVPQKNATNESSQYLVSFVDITEQHRIAEKLEANNASIERLASNIPGFIYKFRMTPDGEFSFPYASKGCKEIFGVEPSSVVNDAIPIINTIHPDDIPEFQESVMISAQQLSPWNLEARLSTVEGEWKWFHAASRPELQENGDIDWEGMVMDVTDRKKAEAELAEAKEIAEASANAKAEFLANMSHEIRTPLNAIIGFTRLTLGTDLAPIQADYIKKVLSSSEVLLGIVNSILDFSKIESGKLNIERIDFSLDLVLENVGNILESKAAEKGIELLIDTPSNDSLDLAGDPLKLEQILINLCSNAIKFTEQGEILISVKAIESSTGTTKLRFSVKDSGIGLLRLSKKKSSNRSRKETIQ